MIVCLNQPTAIVVIVVSFLATLFVFTVDSINLVINFAGLIVEVIAT